MNQERDPTACDDRVQTLLRKCDAAADTIRVRAVHDALREAPFGLDEYALIKALQAAPGSEVPAGLLIEPMILFRCHFLTRNALYRLRDRLLEQLRTALPDAPLRQVTVWEGPDCSATYCP